MMKVSAEQCGMASAQVVFCIKKGFFNVTVSLSAVYISFSPQNYTVREGTSADIMIELDKPSPKDINITITTMDITSLRKY